MKSEIRFVFFGSSDFSVYVLDALESADFSPVCVVTMPDKPAGRRMILTANPVKVWAEERNIKVIEVTTLKDSQLQPELQKIRADVFIVASFGKLIPEDIIYMPPHKTLNVHPSLLPRLRGPAPIQGAILGEKETGVTIMRIDEKMDHGPLVSQKKVDFPVWPTGYIEAEKVLGQTGGELLAEILPLWTGGKIEEKPQNESSATYTKMIVKEDGNISADSPELALRKVFAFEAWPRAYTFYERKDGKKERIIVTSAHIDTENNLVFDKVIPEGKREMSWQEFLRGGR
jgi:methionyl-tRNA formyltransferase